MLLVGTVACAPGARPTPTPAPAAGVVLQKILGDCWGVLQIKDLDGTRADHVRAFECARTRLLQMAEQYPDAAEPHRVLAWGYYYGCRANSTPQADPGRFYACTNDAAAQAEYERAAEIYAQQGRAVDQSDMLVRLAQLALQYDRQRGCNLLAQALTLDPQNGRLTTLLQNFGCIPRTVLPATPTQSPVPLTPIPTTP